MTASNETAEQTVDRFQLAGTVLEKRFQVERLVAEGGFGLVYQGNHLALDKRIAIKVLKTPEEFNEAARAAFMEKFALEAKTIARVSHPNIVQVLDFGVSLMPNGETTPWMVLEWITGQTLEEELAQRRGRGGRTPAEALAMLRPVFEALAYAHGEDIAHRDIKPANIMIVQTKRGSTLRLLDFGIAKLMEEGEDATSGHTRTRTTLAAFSPQYAAPEQIGGTRTGPWTDVHALALIVTEMLTDMPAYDGDDMTSLYGDILSRTRPTPAKRSVDAGTWEPMLAKALAVKPDERFKNAGEFLTALESSVPAGVKALAPAPAVSSMQTGPFAPFSSTVAMTGLPLSATTMRGAAVETPLPGAPSGKRRAGAFAAVGAVVALGVVGAVVLTQARRGAPASAAASRPVAPAPPTVPTPPPNVAVVTPQVVAPPVVAPPVVAPPVVAPPVVATSSTPNTVATVAATAETERNSQRDVRRGGRRGRRDTSGGSAAAGSGGTGGAVTGGTNIPLE